MKGVNLLVNEKLRAKMMHLFPKTQIYLIFLVFCLFSCQNSKHHQLSKTDYSVQFKRFDLALDSLTSTNAAEKHQEWKRTYGAFYKDFVERILPMGAIHDDPEIVAQWIEISNNKNFNDLKKDVKKQFVDLTSYEKSLEMGLKRLHYHLPELILPKNWITYISGFSVQTAVGENYIGIGLDMFLGQDSRFYPALVPDIPQYISRRFTPENVIPRSIESYIREEVLPEESLENNFLSHMIYQGKVMYLLDLSLPTVEDSLKIGYTSDQMKWANRYENSIWDWVLQERMLFNTDYLSFQKHLNEAPFTPELGQGRESAPKLGVFLGWKIVRKFMKENPETSVKELILLQDSQKFLEQAKYSGKS